MKLLNEINVMKDRPRLVMVALPVCAAQCPSSISERSQETLYQINISLTFNALFMLKPDKFFIFLLAQSHLFLKHLLLKFLSSEILTQL